MTTIDTILGAPAAWAQIGWGRALIMKAVPFNV